MDDDRPLADQLTERLLEQRKVLVGGHLDHPTSTNAAALLMLLDGSGDDPIELVLSCPDGDLTAAMALADTVDLVGVELRTLCAGSVGGPAVLPYALGSRRLAQAHATFRLTEPQVEIQGPASRVANETARHVELLTDFHHRLARATGQAFETIAADFQRRRLLTGDEAQAYGLVDEIQGRRLRTV